jgi:hypothetical protein
MGNAVCFPLLCLQNYLAFRFFVRRHVPLRINGDHIVFRSTPEEAKVWSDGVQRCGLKLSLGKTLFSSKFFSLNSTFFVAGKARVRLAPVVRSTALFSPLDDLNSLSGRLDTLKGFNPVRKAYWATMLLKRVAPAIWWSQRSLFRGFDVWVPDHVLKRSGLWDREVFYTSLPAPLDPPEKVITVDYIQRRIPPGWKRVRGGRVDPSVQKEFMEDLLDLAWTPLRADDITLKAERGAFPCDVRTRFDPRKQRLLGFSSRTKFCQYIRSTDILVRKKKVGSPHWVRMGGEGEFDCRPVLFTRAGFA